MKYLKFSSLPATCIFMVQKSRNSFIRLGHATDQKRHLALIRFRIFKMRWVSFANDHLGPKRSQTAQPEGVCDLSNVSQWPWMTSDNSQRH